MSRETAGNSLRAEFPLVGSLLLGLYNREGRLDHVGFTATLHDLDRAALTRRLEELVMTPGFTGDAPGGPSRWSTERTGEWEPLRPELSSRFASISASGGRFRHGTHLVALAARQGPTPMHVGADREFADGYGLSAGGSGRGRRLSPIAT